MKNLLSKVVEMKNYGGLLKGESNEIFDLNDFSSSLEPAWATFQRVKKNLREFRFRQVIGFLR